MSGTPLNKQTKRMVLVYSTDVNAEIEQKLRVINYDHQVDLILDAYLRIVLNIVGRKQMKSTKKTFAILSKNKDFENITDYPDIGRILAIIDRAQLHSLYKILK